MTKPAGMDLMEDLADNYFKAHQRCRLVVDSRAEQSNE